MESHHKKQMQRTHQRKGWRICETGGGVATEDGGQTEYLYYIRYQNLQINRN